MERSFNKIINPSKLDLELKTSSFNDIFLGLSYSYNNVVITFSRDLTGVEDTDLLTLVNNHTPTFLGYKIWSLVEDKKPAHYSPLDINFDILPLAIKKTYAKGEEDVFTYYKTAVINSDGSIIYSDPILQTSWIWTHDPQNFPVYAEEKVQWFLEDETLGGAEKVVPHYFDGLHKIRKGKECRGIRVDNMQIPVSSMIVYNETVRRATEEGNPEYILTVEEMGAALEIGRSFLSAYQISFSNYVEHKDLQLVADVTNGTETFLDWVNPYSPPNTIRDYILSELPE